MALSLGDVERPWYPRSANKPLQAVGLLDAGWQPASAQQVALACASHSGEEQHLAVVRGLLAPLGEDALGCPPQLPLDEAAAHALLAAGGGPSRLHMNCSGKHAAMLATCRERGWPTEGYLDPAHPVQAAVQAALERLAGEPAPGRRRRRLRRPAARAHPARPGQRLLRARHRRARHAQSTGWPRQCAPSPSSVGGTGRDVTRLMQVVPGLVAKDGAEGVYAAALPDGSARRAQDRRRREAGRAGRRRRRAGGPRGRRGHGSRDLAVLPVLGGGRPVGEVRPAGALAAARPSSPRSTSTT